MSLLPKHLKDPQDRARFLASVFGDSEMSASAQIMLVTAKLMEWEAEAFDEGYGCGANAISVSD